MEAAISKNEPFPVKVEEGKSYFWCSCGQSTKQPLCDGSHKGTSFLPLKYVATENKDIYFCGCKQTKKTTILRWISQQIIKKRVNYEKFR
jgi:CDGSH-type Zn-finger protein